MEDLTTCCRLKEVRQREVKPLWRLEEDETSESGVGYYLSEGSSPSRHSSLTQAGVADRLSLEQKAGEGGAVGGAVPAPAGGGANAIRGGSPARPSRPSSPGADGTGRLSPPRDLARPPVPAASAAVAATAAPAAAADGPGQATGECPPLLPEGGLGTRAGPTG